MKLADTIAAEAEPKVGKLRDQDLIVELEDRGFIITKDAATHRVREISAQPAGKVRFAVCSDTHLGHRHQQITHLRDFYAKATAWGAEFMLHAGDLVDGQNMHRDQQFELFRHGVDAQAKYAIFALPELRNKKRQLLKTYVIGGNHDGSGWNDVGANVLGQLADNRPDIEFLGAPTATFHHGPLRIMLMHPDGGPSYARSYRLQKIVEGFEADSKPHLLLAGHWHIQAHVHVRNVHAFALPCFQSQTAYLKRKGLQPVVGGLLVEADYDDRGLLDLTTKWVLYPNPTPHDF